MVYTLEPLWGAGFAWLLLGERWGPMGWVGASLILGELCAACQGAQWRVGSALWYSSCGRYCCGRQAQCVGKEFLLLWLLFNPVYVPLHCCHSVLLQEEV